MKSAFRLFTMVLVSLVVWPVAASAAGVWVTDDGQQHLGARALYLLEQDAPLTLEQARQRFANGQAVAASHDALSFGIGNKPVWVRVLVENPGDGDARRLLLAGAPWLDLVDAWFVDPDGAITQVRAGDSSARLQAAVPALGYLFEHDWQPGISELLLRVETDDPLVLPMTLMGPSAWDSTLQAGHYAYGFVYGFLLALLAYNLMLFIGLRQRSHLNYSVYLASFIAMNLAYTGHGYAWLWPGAVDVQRYIIFVFMALFACAGLRFASGFLALRDYSPRMAKAIGLGCAAFMAALVATIAMGLHREAAYVAFTMALLFSLVMVELGWAAVARRYPAGRYFLAAACFGMAGTLITTLTVWGWVPYSRLAYRAVEFGLLVEATLLALAVAYLVRRHEMARRQAEHRASIDPLTGLCNRRALASRGEALLAMARRNGQPLSLVLFDLDHFKLINDRHGHAAGDQVLRDTARLMEEQCRAGDLTARWGGEEFLFLLPDTDVVRAQVLVTRLREYLQDRIQLAGQGALPVSASFGIAGLDDEQTLEQLVNKADRMLYEAKRQGRDRVCVIGPAAEQNGLPVDGTSLP
ncbi:MAG: sensor domain-containing diguanylate cyclase [Alcanivoracaceae bacterium]|nr:sensor domain-containing diguanylate cyclase [Alcanivoracaceae bacterium]